jgi:hypothetical protein
VKGAPQLDFCFFANFFMSVSICGYRGYNCASKV